jgi:hypothetical protein
MQSSPPITEVATREPTICTLPKREGSANTMVHSQKIHFADHVEGTQRNDQWGHRGGPDWAARTEMAVVCFLLSFSFLFSFIYMLSFLTKSRIKGETH